MLFEILDLLIADMLIPAMGLFCIYALIKSIKEFIEIYKNTGPEDEDEYIELN